MDTELLVGGFQAGAFILLAVQGLKVFNFVSGENAPKAAVITGLVLGVLSAVESLVPASAPYIATFVRVFIGAMTAGLGYEYLVRPALNRFGVSVSSSELNE